MMKMKKRRVKEELSCMLMFCELYTKISGCLKRTKSSKRLKKIQVMRAGSFERNQNTLVSKSQKNKREFLHVKMKNCQHLHG